MLTIAEMGEGGIKYHGNIVDVLYGRFQGSGPQGTSTQYTLVQFGKYCSKVDYCKAIL